MSRLALPTHARIIAATLVATAGTIFAARASLLLYLLGLVNWTGIAVLIVPKPERRRFVAAMLTAALVIFATRLVGA